jgi:CBS-domain-containing membrane protein
MAEVEMARRGGGAADGGGMDDLPPPITAATPPVPAAGWRATDLPETAMMRSVARASAVGGQIQVVAGLLRRLRLPALSERHHPVLVLGAFSFLNGCLSIGLMAGAAYLLRSPLIFPSLGATAFLLFSSPDSPAAAPRNTVVGHVVGVAAGFLALVAFGLTQAGPSMADMLTAPRVGASALSLGLTAGVLTWLRTPHPPGGATTLIVSLGFFTTPLELLALLAAVGALVLQAIAINRLAGLDYPLWAPRPSTDC